MHTATECVFVYERSLDPGDSSLSHFIQSCVRVTLTVLRILSDHLLLTLNCKLSSVAFAIDLSVPFEDDAFLVEYGGEFY